MKNIFSNDTKFALFMNALADIIWIGLLWVVVSVPIVTMGAASCAAYQSVVKAVRGRRSGVTGLFFETFKENFSITWPMKLTGIFIVGLLGFDCIYLYGYGTDFSRTLSLILYIMLALDVAFVSYLYPLTSRFDEKRTDLLKISFFLTFRYFHISVLLTVMFLLCVFCCYIMPWSVIVVPGLYWYIMSFPVKYVLSRLKKDEDEDDEEGEEYEENYDDEADADSNVNKKDKDEDKGKENKEDVDDEDDSKSHGTSVNTVTVTVKRRRLKNPWRKKQQGENSNDGSDSRNDMTDDIYEENYKRDELKSVLSSMMEEKERNNSEDEEDRIIRKK